MQRNQETRSYVTTRCLSGPRDKTSEALRDLVVSPAMGVSTVEPGVVGVWCVVVVSYQEYSLTHSLTSLNFGQVRRIQEYSRTPKCSKYSLTHESHFRSSAASCGAHAQSTTGCHNLRGKRSRCGTRRSVKCEDGLVEDGWSCPAVTHTFGT